VYAGTMEVGLNKYIGLMQQAPGQTNPRQGQKSKILEMQQRAQLGKGNINRCYRFFDWLYEKMYRRMIRSTLQCRRARSRRDETAVH